MKSNSRVPYIIGGVLIFLLLGGLIISNLQGQNRPRSAAKSGTTTPKTDNGGIIPTRNPQDIVPGLYKNPIANPATVDGFLISSAKVENNTGDAGKVVNDHLELTLKNISGKNITNFEAYYTIAESGSNKKEGYYKKLTGLALKNGETQTIHFDNKQGYGHFSANINSIYYTSKKKLLFDIMVSASEYKIQKIQIAKDAGGAETKD